MNLLAKSLGQLAVLAVALFFFSCEDPTSLGYENPDKKFDVNYVDIPLESSVLLLDSIRTSNFTFTTDFNRFLAGQYTDPVFGTVNAAFFSQFFTNSTVRLPNNATYDSVTLQLGFDLYNYGSSSASMQTYSVYQLADSLTGATKLTNNSDFATGALLGSQSYFVDPSEFKKYVDNGTDTALTLNIKLNQEYGQSLYDMALRYKNATSVEDSAFVFFSKFIQTFKGIAVKADVADKIVRFSPTTSRIIVHYHTVTSSNLGLILSLSGVTGFSQIKSDWSSTELSGLIPYQDYLADGATRYIQSGTGVFTKVDLSNFYEFADTIPNAIINSAEFVITDVDPTYPPPTNLGFRLLNENNRERKFSRVNSQDIIDNNAYSGFLRFDTPISNAQDVIVQPDSVFYFINDLSSAAIMSYSSDKKTYNGFATLFTQQLFTKDNRSKLKHFVLYPLSPKASKSVNRTTFPTDKIRLRIHYTLPKNLNL
jgi:hypothetical protein